MDLGALVQNGRTIAAHAGRPLLPMVKADGYGLGAVRAAHALESLQPWGFGVATVEEGIELRSSGIDRPILVCTPVLRTELPRMADARLTPALHDPESIGEWGKTGLPWHLSVDTGMSRAGIPWFLVAELHGLLRTHPPQGVFTHFHSAELPDDTAALQLERFTTVVEALPQRPELVHAENSAAIQRFGRSAFDVVRPGIFLYGVGVPMPNAPAAVPVVSMHGRVVDIREVPAGDTVSYLQTYRAVGDRRIATLALGYADGYPRAASNRGWAMLNGRRVPVAGLVTMDMTMLDVTGIPCELGDIATLLGNPAEGAPDVSRLAFHAEMSPYELLTRMRCRIERRYVVGSESLPAGGERAHPSLPNDGGLRTVPDSNGASG